MRVRALATFALCAALFTVGTTPARAQPGLTVFAAASLRDALDAVNAAFTRARGDKVVVSYAATSALVRQIGQGAPANVFISADIDWMDYAARNALIVEATRASLLGNRLVLIAAKDAALGPVAIGVGVDIAALAGDGRIALADVKAVPAGRYAKAALESLGAWQAARGKLAQAENVRAALAYVARGETAVGIVYATDARRDPGVRVIGTFPQWSHPPVIYQVAATRAAGAGMATLVAAYLDFLRTPAAKSIFEDFGFVMLARPAA
ncbi:MAG: molybdate ABC transporter substrate-binding protein [Proteobacteria bacterium]|nr:molybdate ABC transporter substrate-binding protein [Pseudomonadota bacterium]